MAVAKTIRIGTRGSALARAQTAHVAGQLGAAHPTLAIETVIIKTSGDRITDRPLHQFGGKGLFVKELEQALLDKTIDVAVHSYKDVPVTMPLVPMENLIIAAVPVREDPRQCADFAGGAVDRGTAERRARWDGESASAMPIALSPAGPGDRADAREYRYAGSQDPRRASRRNHSRDGGVEAWQFVRSFDHDADRSSGDASSAVQGAWR